MTYVRDPKYSLAVRAVKAVLSRHAGAKLNTKQLKDFVENELILNKDYDTDFTQEHKDGVLEEFQSAIHWMASKGILTREDDPNNPDDYVWSAGTGKAWKVGGKRRRPLSERDQLRGLARPEDTPQVPNPFPPIKKEEVKKSMEYNPLADRVKILEGQITRYAETVEELSSEIETWKKSRRVEFTIVTNGKPVKIKEKVHSVFPQVLFHLECGDFPMLVGPSGCGKTELAIQMARHLKMRFGMLSWHGGMTESQLYGKTIPNITGGKEVYMPADFADFYENSGLFLHDEIDGGDPNVLLSLNGPLSNKKMKLPRKVNPLIDMHKNFRCIATANTWGNGADRHYVGRNQMDGATVKRFTLIDMDYDEALEMALCPGQEDMVKRLQTYRANMIRNKIQRVIDTRFIIRAYNWKRHKKDDDYVDAMLFKGWREDEIRKVKGGY